MVLQEINLNGEDSIRPLQKSKDAMRYFLEGSKLEVIAGADHDFYEQLDQFIAHSVSWYKEHLPIERKS